MRPRDFRTGYVRRVIDDELDDLFGELPAVLLDGPKGVGKTATALRRASTVRRLDQPSEREVLGASPGLVAADVPPVLIDEWHRVPEVFDAVRRAVDDDRAGGRFLLTGSAPTRSVHSGAGRIVAMRMRPLTLFERLEIGDRVSFSALLAGSAQVSGRCELSLTDYAAEIETGGFPGLRGVEPRARARQLDGYIQHIVDRDLADGGLMVRRPATVLAWLRAYGAATATVASWEKIRDAASAGSDARPAKTTTMPYIEVLTMLRVLDPLDAWMPTRGVFGALGASPKHHLADPALAARLCRRGATQLLRGEGPDVAIARDGSFLGALFESLAALSVRTFAQCCDARVFHLRTRGGRQEIDLIVERPDGAVLAIEVKLSSTVGDDDVRHLDWLRSRLGDECVDTVVLHTGPQAYRRPDGVAVVPLGMLAP